MMWYQNIMTALVSALAFLIANPVFVYELGDIPPAEQARIVAETGFAGTVFDHARDLPERLRAVDEQHLQLFYLWLTVDVGKGRIENEPGMEAAIRALAGRETVIWLAVTGAGEGAEQRAIEASRKVADLAAQSKLRVALYPHYGFYLARFHDVVRVARAADRSNLGVTFNLCHELRSGFEPGFNALLKQSIPMLYGATVNGADNGGRDWSTLIQPFGDGTYDSAATVRLLVHSGYRGPIGLQCYGIKSDPRVFLKRAMNAWRAIE